MYVCMYVCMYDVFTCTPILLTTTNEKLFQRVFQLLLTISARGTNTEEVFLYYLFITIITIAAIITSAFYIERNILMSSWRIGVCFLYSG